MIVLGRGHICNILKVFVADLSTHRRVDSREADVLHRLLAADPASRECWQSQGPYTADRRGAYQR